jgi:UMF1 family MFS transporter
MLKIGDKKLINAWAFYDWANSVYSLVISTAVFPLFYSGITKGKVISFLGMEWEHPDTLYSYTLSFSFLVVALMSPILSAIADYTGNKKKFLKIFCTIGAVSVMSLYFFEGLDTVWIGIVFTFFASIGFWSSVVFYNSYLPEVAHPEDQDRVSAKGLWWIGFAQITFKALPNNRYEKKPEKEYIWKGFRELKIVWLEIKQLPTLKGFLVAFFLLSIGVQTIILLAAIFGSTELGLSAINLIVTILLIQFVAIFGAFIFSRISEKYGNFKALKITLLIWILVCFCAFLLHKDLQNVESYFYALGVLLGLVLGAIQSLTRSTYSKLLPKTKDHATYFSFYDVTEKIAIVLGTFVYGFLYAVTDSMQWSVLCLGLFFVASLLVLSRLKSTAHVY